MNINTGATPTGIGTGEANTAIISASCGSGTAARICSDLVINGYDDWFLPSNDELLAMFLASINIELGFSYNTYWSSSELSSTYALFYNGYQGYMAPNPKTAPAGVRAIRAF